jgi:hypothetical protein
MAGNCNPPKRDQLDAIFSITGPKKEIVFAAARACRFSGASSGTFEPWSLSLSALSFQILIGAASASQGSTGFILKAHTNALLLSEASNACCRVLEAVALKAAHPPGTASNPESAQSTFHASSCPKFFEIILRCDPFELGSAQSASCHAASLVASGGATEIGMLRLPFIAAYPYHLLSTSLLWPGKVLNHLV